MSPMTRAALLILSALALNACGMTPYVIPEGAPTARINLNAAGQRAWICAADGEGHTLTPDAEGYASIAAGERVVVGSSFYSQGYNVSYSCYPRVNFVPEAGGSYYQNFEIEAERCGVFIYREGADNPAGLAIEPSLRPGGACAK
ncbi:MAG: hypothetical protein Q8Q73_19285 [Stagnimonas sp.]|nr:hypothetical protein [Stagnimonas sp.]